MANSNPAFNNPAFKDGYRPPVSAPATSVAPGVPTPSAEQLQEQYSLPTPSADSLERMTYEDTIVKTVISFLVLIAGAAVGFVFPVLTIPAAIIGFVLALVNIFKKRPSAALVLAYAAFEGVFVGGISAIFAQMFNGGIVPMAVFGTLGVVGVTLALFASGKVRASRRATKIFLVALVGYAVFSLINVGLMVFGVTDSFQGARDFLIPGTSIPLGIPLGILVVLLAAYSLVLDFDSIQQGVRNGAPRIYAWSGAFGILVTVVWLYLEILRLLSYFMPRN